MKYLIMNQNFYKSKFPLFHKFKFLELMYFINGANILQIVFDFITYSKITYFFSLVFPNTLLTCPK